jgi:hypothetical protein
MINLMEGVCCECWVRMEQVGCDDRSFKTYSTCGVESSDAATTLVVFVCYILAVQLILNRIFVRFNFWANKEHFSVIFICP